MCEENWAELFDIYVELLEKQDEIIYRMGKIIARQSETLRLLENDHKFSDPKLDEEIAIMEEVRKDYEDSTRP